MRILQVHPTFTSVKGGVERHIEGLSKYLARRGHHVDILTTERGRDIACEGGRVAVKRVSKFTSPFGFNSYDIVHVHGYRVPWANVFGLFRKLGGSRVVMTTHGIYPPRSRMDALAKRTYDQTLGGVNVRLLDAFIALTPETRDALLALGAQQEKICIIPNCIDTERFKKLPSPEVFLNQHRIPPEAQVILYVGRVDWNKGLDVALASFHLIVKEVPDAVLVIVGRDYGYSSFLKELSHKFGLDDRVFLIGEVDEEDLYSAYAAADVFLLTSVYEGLPTVVLEAMACGVPVIASRTGGTAYIFNGGDVGFLTDFGDVTSTARSMTILLTDDGLRNALGENGRTLVEKRYSWAENSIKVEQLYNHISA